MTGLPPTIVHNLARGRDLFADRPLLIGDSGQVTYTEFAELVEGAVRRLSAEGMRVGDRLAACLRNGLDVAVAIWACARGGFVFVGLPTNLDAAAWDALLTHAEPALILAHPEFLPALPGHARPVADHLTGCREEWDEAMPLPDPDDIYALIYTSGTTGLPKGVTVSHRATMHVAGFYRDLLRLGPADVTAIHLPFSYVSGHISQLNPFMLAGGSAVTMPSFSARGLIRLAREHGVSVIDVVPWMFTMLLHEPGFSGHDLPRLRAAIFGGSPMPAPTVRALRERIPRLHLHNVYGMTETGGLIACLPNDELDGHLDTVGHPVPGVQVTISSDGEILVRRPVVTRGYWRNAVATAAVTDNGWLHTGDNGSMDAAGFVHVHDRMVEMINRGGVKISPSDVEQALASHPAVAEAAAFAIPDGQAGQAVAACVVAVGDRNISIRELRSWVRERLPVHARPRQLRIVTGLPRNPTGKVDLGALREIVAGHPAADTE